ncbi:MAG TPA: APC family permease [Nitrospirota bacterium]|nr:APC family permease [Nitrospirota bacterium]
MEQIINFLFGRPLSSDEDKEEKIGAAVGIPVFGLDALGSAAYGPEAALSLLIPLGLTGIQYVVPISLCIIALLAIVYLSYSQTIDAYQSGGGSYTVASQNIGAYPGLLAAAALAIDYVLVVAVGISAGVGALVSAIPSLQSYTLTICLVILAIISIVNLRGTRETGAFFLVPTYLFVSCLAIAIIIGVYKTIIADGHPIPAESIPRPIQTVEAVKIWLLLKVFSSGCTAMTGVEAVSNGVTVFKEPRAKSAKQTLTTIIAILMLLLLGIAYLCKAYHIGATDPEASGYESVLSQLVRAIIGKGIFYYISMGSILLVLALQANTSFADFPRLCRVVAQDGYMPRLFANRGRRLVYSHGIFILIFLSAVILIIFGGITDRLIPLFAIGAFLAFTLSQAGMVAHWIRVGGKHAARNMIINGVGAVATAITTIVVMMSKFTEGAWITMLLIPMMLIIMISVKRHYNRVERETSEATTLPTENLNPPLVIIPMERWTKISQKAVRFALTISRDITTVHVDYEEGDGGLGSKWKEYVEEPCSKAGLPIPKLEVIKSPYRLVITPIYKYILDMEKKLSDRKIALIIPTLVEAHWFQRMLHNNRAKLITALLLLRGNRRIVVINVPWYLDEEY